MRVYADESETTKANNLFQHHTLFNYGRISINRNCQHLHITAFILRIFGNEYFSSKTHLLLFFICPKATLGICANPDFPYP